MVEKVEIAKAGREPKIRKKPEMEMPSELDARMLRVGDKLYRSANDKQPFATISADRIKAKDSASLPDLVRLAKANGWTAIKVDGDAEFQRAAYLAASAQGLKVDGYRPDALTKAAAERDQARQAGGTPTKDQAPRTANQARDSKEQPDPRIDLAERFRRQSDVQNAKDPELRRAQSHVAMAMTLAEGRYPGEPVKQREFVAERKEDVASRIGRGEKIAGIEVKRQQSEQVRQIEQNQVLQKDRHIGGR